MLKDWIIFEMSDNIYELPTNKYKTIDMHILDYFSICKIIAFRKQSELCLIKRRRRK